MVGMCELSDMRLNKGIVINTNIYDHAAINNNENMCAGKYPPELRDDEVANISPKQT